MQIILTDITRFPSNDKVCTAGVCLESNRCVRPMPYLKFEEFKKLSILPGAIIDGEFGAFPKNDKPHIEDCRRLGSLTYHGPCTPEDFEKALMLQSADNVCSGFDGCVQSNSRVIPTDKAPGKSIISLLIKPDQIVIVRDKYNKEKIKLHLTDNNGIEYSFMPITDLGFFDMAKRNAEKTNYLDKINAFIHSQDHVILRLGLSREYEAPDGRKGYWIQANGIYTFPEFLTEIRSY